MSPTDAQVRATKKYLEKFEELKIRVPKGEKEIIAAHAAKQGESLNVFVRRAIYRVIKQDNGEE